MKRFEVEVVRTEHRTKTLEIFAKDEDGAEELAREAAGNHCFKSGPDAEYEVMNVVQIPDCKDNN